ncbi:hypothetical protein BOTBODRAFT_36489 [Botryobasidium botryosum FD-172 SS1]|uniref:Arrestin C-terminal-like domain-containing protein n=1 Tax=Botryobasidium botryosum (strain FD-172 SS1) TaxID=930990 RepID=A0A067M679_BOTB1|nr:hypothetical protein BOTBODRAFT_36489 [Botryobasidium botryosum FD-172 SS1]
MSSQVKITLRPPPHVEFVDGYPGIPQSPERPQAAIKGSVELRPAPGHPVKAKWVRLELRKIETLPGGGQTNTFIDFIGQSPVNVWQAQNEWDLLQTQDIPFHLRIPESIPPSIALERGAGIKYDLVVSLCVKGKKGFFHRNTSPTISANAQIIIDKHELHSAWPIYAQPDARSSVGEGVTLIVERTFSCYGPGDRVVVRASVRADHPSFVVLRAYEFALRETVIYRPIIHPGSSKKSGPQVRTTHLGEQKVPMNAQLPRGMQHTAELGCQIPLAHKMMTVNTARYIEVSYSIHVAVILGDGKQVAVNLPITLTNWPRSVSVDAVRRIGFAPNLSGPGARPPSIPGTQSPPLNLLPPQIQQRPYSVLDKASGRPDTASGAPAGPFGETLSSGYSGADKPNGYLSPTGGDMYEFGAPNGPNARPNTYHEQSFNSRPTAAAPVSVIGTPSFANGPSSVGHSSPPTTAQDDSRRPGVGPRVRSKPGTGDGTAASRGNRFTVVNADMDAPEVTPQPKPKYLTAEDEKRRIREQRDEADRAYQKQSQSAGAGAGPPGYNTNTNKQEPAAATPAFANPAGNGAPLPAFTSPPAAAAALPQQSEIPQVVPGSPPPTTRPSEAIASPQPGGSSSAAGAPTAAERRWLSAEEEKRLIIERQRLYDSAIAQAKVVHQRANSPEQAPSASSEYPPTLLSGHDPVSSITTPSVDDGQRLYAEALAKTQRAQAQGQGLPAFSPPTAHVPLPYNAVQPQGGFNQTHNRPNSSFDGGPTAAHMSPLRRPSAGPAPIPGASAGAGVGAGAGFDVPGAGSYFKAPGQTISAGAALYSHGMQLAQASKAAAAGSSTTSGYPNHAGGSQPAAPQIYTPGGGRQWASADEEKAQVRYHNAQRAVLRQQGSEVFGGSPPSSDPIAYDALYSAPPPGHPAGAVPGYASPPQAYASPPPMNGGYRSPPLSPPAAPLSEKERMRQYYAAQDAVARQQGASSGSPPPPAQYTPGPGPGPDYSSPPAHMYNHPEFTPRGHPTPPGYADAPPPAADYPPPPNMNGQSSRPLNAAEEKAMLRARYAAEQQGSSSPGSVAGPPPPMSPPARSLSYSNGNGVVNGNGNGHMAAPQPTRAAKLSAEPETLTRDPSISWGKKRAPTQDEPAPPPLMPRPPAEYIQETQEEDAKMPKDDHDHDSEPLEAPDYSKPYNPYDLSFQGTPPPLPPKVPLQE